MKIFSKSFLTLSILLFSASAMAQGLTGFYQSQGLSGGSFNQPSVNNTNFSNFNPPNYNFNTPVNQPTQSIGFGNNFQTQGGGGLTGFYGNNGLSVSNNNFNQGGGGLSAFYGQNLQANTFGRNCPNRPMPDPRACNGGQFRQVLDNFGCTAQWRCEGGNFCPVVEQPAANLCNGTWEPQYTATTGCLTNYFCDRTSDIPTVCPANYDPVCGTLTDGTSQTFSNQCQLDAAGAQFRYRGVCTTQPNPPTNPVINSFNGPTTLSVGQTGTWRVNALIQGNSRLSYSIDWGETIANNRSQSRMMPRPSQSSTFTHQYSQAGTYTVRVTVSNEQGQSVSASTQVRVDSGSTAAPTITSFTGPQTLEVGQSGTWNVMATDVIDRNVEFSIEWGDLVYNQVRSADDYGRGSSRSFQKTYTRAGTYRVTVTATSGGQSTSRTLNVRVTDRYQGGNLAPVVRGISGPTTLEVNQTGTWRVQASDPQNQDLRYQINWGDRVNAANASYSSDAGFVQNSAFTHQYSQPGTYTVSVTVMNTAGQTARTTTTVRVDQEPVYEPYQPSVPNTPNSPYQPYTQPSYQSGYQFSTVPQFNYNSGGLEFQPNSQFQSARQYNFNNTSNRGARNNFFNQNYGWR
jgi:PKD repeat protein